MTREEQRVRNSAHPRFVLEALAIKLARLSDLRAIEDLIARVDQPTPGRPPGEADETPKGPQGGAQSPGKRTAPAPGPRPASSVGAAAAVESATPIRPQAEPGDQAAVEAFLKRVHEERGALGGFLEEASWIEIKGETLEIAFGEKHGFFREKIEGRENLEYLKRMAGESAGRDLTIKVTVATPGAVESRTLSPGDAEESRRRRLRETAEKTPIVRTLLNAFDGQIVDVDQV